MLLPSCCRMPRVMGRSVAPVVSQMTRAVTRGLTMLRGARYGLKPVSL